MQPFDLPQQQVFGAPVYYSSDCARLRNNRSNEPTAGDLALGAGKVWYLPNEASKTFVLRRLEVILPLTGISAEADCKNHTEAGPTPYDFI